MIRYLIWREQLKKGEAFGVSVLLLFVFIIVTILLSKSIGHSHQTYMAQVFVASFLSFIILRAEDGVARSVEASTLQQKTGIPQKKQVEAEPKASIPTTNETETIPAPQTERVESVRTEKPTKSDSHADEQFYEQVAAEFKDGTTKQGLRLKAETKAGGDKNRARLLYIEWRVQQLIEEAEVAERERLIKLEVDQKAEQKRKTVQAIKDSEAAVVVLNGLKKYGYKWESDYSSMGDFYGFLLFKDGIEVARLKTPSEVITWMNEILPQ